MRSKLLLTGAAVGAIGFVAPAHGELIPGFDLQASPTFEAGFITNAYNSGADTYTASGFALTLNGVDLAAPGQFSINAIIDDMGNASSGSLSIEGEVGAPLVGADSLLTGSLVDFGFPVLPADFETGPFQFVFLVTGGDLADDFGGIGSSVAVRLTQNIGYDGDWLDDFSGGGALQPSLASTAPLVPGPSALVALLGAGVLGTRRRRRR